MVKSFDSADAMFYAEIIGNFFGIWGDGGVKPEWPMSCFVVVSRCFSMSYVFYRDGSRIVFDF